MSMVRHRALALAAGLATAIMLAFVLLPVAAIFSRAPLGTLLAQLHSRVALDALRVSLKTSIVAVTLIVALGTPAAYVLATRRFVGHAAILTVLELPLVLPPAVAGIALFAAFGRFGLLGGALRAFGVELPFTQVAVVMALAFVAAPFYVRQAVAAFASLDVSVLGAARTLGAGPGRTFLRVAVPLARPGLSAGAALAWARALGEFGATIMFAGSLPGRTQTLPLAIYVQFTSGGVDSALAMAALLVAVSAGLLLGVRLLLRAGRSAEKEGGEPRTARPAFASTPGIV
jgi:molybdate transport system permease protein